MKAPVVCETSFSRAEMTALILYDDFAMAWRAGAALQRAGRRTDDGIRWSVKSWPLDLLNPEIAAGEAMTEAVDAHLLVFAVGMANALPGWVMAWLERWAALRRVPEATMAIFGRSPSGWLRRVPPSLSQFARRHGLGLLQEHDVTRAGSLVAGAGAPATDFFEAPYNSFTAREP